MRSFRRLPIAVWGLCALLVAATAAQQSSSPVTPQIPAQELVRRVIANEDKASKQHVRLLYRLRSETPKSGALTKELVVTIDGVVARLFAVNVKPPSAD